MKLAAKLVLLCLVAMMLLTGMISGTSRLATYYPFNLEDQTGNARKGGLELMDSLEQTEREAWHKIWTGLLSVGAMALFCTAIVVIGGFLTDRQTAAATDRTNGSHRRRQV